MVGVSVKDEESDIDSIHNEGASNQLLPSTENNSGMPEESSAIISDEIFGLDNQRLSDVTIALEEHSIIDMSNSVELKNNSDSKENRSDQSEVPTLTKKRSLIDKALLPDASAGPIKKNDTALLLNDSAENKAAATIQSIFRGYQSRKKSQNITKVKTKISTPPPPPPPPSLDHGKLDNQKLIEVREKRHKRRRKDIVDVEVKKGNGNIKGKSNVKKQRHKNLPGQASDFREDRNMIEKPSSPQLVPMEQGYHKQPRTYESEVFSLETEQGAGRACLQVWQTLAHLVRLAPTLISSEQIRRQNAFSESFSAAKKIQMQRQSANKKSNLIQSSVQDKRAQSNVVKVPAMKKPGPKISLEPIRLNKAVMMRQQLKKDREAKEAKNVAEEIKRNERWKNRAKKITPKQTKTNNINNKRTRSTFKQPSDNNCDSNVSNNSENVNECSIDSLSKTEFGMTPLLNATPSLIPRNQNKNVSMLKSPKQTKNTGVDVLPTANNFVYNNLHSDIGRSEMIKRQSNDLSSNVTPAKIGDILAPPTNSKNIPLKTPHHDVNISKPSGTRNAISVEGHDDFSLFIQQRHDIMNRVPQSAQREEKSNAYFLPPPTYYINREMSLLGGGYYGGHPVFAVPVPQYNASDIQGLPVPQPQYSFYLPPVPPNYNGFYSMPYSYYNNKNVYIPQVYSSQNQPIQQQLGVKQGNEPPNNKVIKKGLHRRIDKK